MKQETRLQVAPPPLEATEPLEMLARRGCFIWLHTYSDGTPFVVLGGQGDEEWSGPRHDGATVLEAIGKCVASLPEVQREAMRADLPAADQAVAAGGEPDIFAPGYTWHANADRGLLLSIVNTEGGLVRFRYAASGAVCEVNREGFWAVFSPERAPAEQVAGEEPYDFEFGCHPADSAALLRLRESIDAADVWPSDSTKEAGDYEAAVEYMAHVAKMHHPPAGGEPAQPASPPAQGDYVTRAEIAAAAREAERTGGTIAQVMYAFADSLERQR